ncbi:MAG: hypothetical protein AAF086_07615, partial [Planctomycetota bacterium]
MFDLKYGSDFYLGYKFRVKIMNSNDDQVNQLEIEKLRLEILQLKKTHRTFYDKYGDLIRLVIGFVLTGVIGTTVATLIQHSLEASKVQQVKNQRLIE